MLGAILNILIPLVVAFFVVYVIVKGMKKAKKGESCSMCGISDSAGCGGSCGCGKAPEQGKPAEAPKN